MTQLRTIDAAALAAMNRALVGFDRYFMNAVPGTNNNYPPHNIVKYSETEYGIEVAIAGFSKDEVSVEVDQSRLIVRGVKAEVDESKEYMHRGLATRNFEQNWQLAEHMEVRDAEIKDGMLLISIQSIVPEPLKPRQVVIK